MDVKPGLSQQEEHKLRVFENRVVRIFEPNREEDVGDRRRLHNEELHNLYFLSFITYGDQIKEDEMS
jgi:hypothetical protein